MPSDLWSLECTIILWIRFSISRYTLYHLQIESFPKLHSHLGRLVLKEMIKISDSEITHKNPWKWWNKIKAINLEQSTTLKRNEKKIDCTLKRWLIEWVIGVAVNWLIYSIILFFNTYNSSNRYLRQNFLHTEKASWGIKLKLSLRKIVLNCLIACLLYLINNALSTVNRIYMNSKIRGKITIYKVKQG